MKIRLLFALVLLNIISTVFVRAASAPKPASSVYEAGLTLSPVVVTRTTDFRHFDNGGGLRADFDFTQNIGLTVETTGNNTRGLLVDDGFVGLRYGVPRGSLRPYVIAGLGYRFTGDDPFWGAGLGIEYKLKHNISAGLEAVGEKPDDQDWGARFQVRLGLSF